MEKINLKHYLFLIAILFNTLILNAVVVIQQEQPVVPENDALTEVIKWIIFIMFFGLISLIFIGLFVWIAVKIYNYLTRHEKSKYDFLYKMYEQDLQQTNLNKDSKLKYRNWKLFFIFFKRTPVYVNTKERGMEVLGFYNGECFKKENFYLIGVYNKMGLFKFTEQILIFPIHLSHLVIKSDINGKRTIMLNCEGADLIANTDFYLMPLIFDPKKDKEFLDFSDFMYDHYFEKTVYRDIIKENLLQYRDGIIKSVETNPNVHFNRRNEQGGNK